MNATSLYVSTSRLVLQNEGEESENWTDLYRLIPYLRQSLSCAICSNLLKDPYTPTKLQCQHNICKQCLERKRNIKLVCPFCKTCESYSENMQLRILLQCYKRLCEHILTIPIYNAIKRQKHSTLASGKPNFDVSLVDFIEEGATFQDNFNYNSGLKRSDYSILPCVFARSDVKVPLTEEPFINNLSRQQQSNAEVNTDSLQPINQQAVTVPIKTVSNGSAMYSVLYTGIGNKITIKRKVESDEEANFKELHPRVNSRSTIKRRGCRCGNAAITPGKLTCCGQRCPCYVESKSCLSCKCRGCRNPHRPDGGKVRPHIPELACYEIQLADDNPSSSISMTANGDFMQIPLQNYKPADHMVREIPMVNTAHQKTCSIKDNIANESYIVTEGSIEVVNVFTSEHHSPNNPGKQDSVHSRNIGTRPEMHQIVMESKDTSNVVVANDRSHHNASIFFTSNSSPSIALSPLIVTASNSIPCQIFSPTTSVATDSSLSDLARNEEPHNQNNSRLQ